MTPTENDLTAAIMQFQDERVNPDACDAAQAAELENISSSPPSNLIICKDGSRSLVGKHTLSDGTKIVLKYYYPRNLAKKINYGLRGSRAMRSWIAARAFEALGIPTPSAMLIREEKGVSRITLKQSFLAYVLAPGVPLSEITEDEDQARLRMIAKQLKEAFTIMVNYRISHGDLKANNIIVDSNHRIRFIDLDGAAILSSPKDWRGLWERDRTRFLRNWPEGSLAYRLFSETITPA
jgi:tRNA A-37 threonylcarbamoyl transferase component Bud32